MIIIACLPFPMHWFAPPQKPEFERIIESTPNAFDKWDEALKHLRSYCKGKETPG